MEKPKIIVLSPQGDKKTAMDFEFKELLDKTIKENPDTNILINLKDLKYVNSIFLWAMLASKRKLERKNLNLKICNPTQFVKDVFDMVKLEKMIEIFYDEEEAIKSFED